MPSSSFSSPLNTSPIRTGSYRVSRSPPPPAFTRRQTTALTATSPPPTHLLIPATQSTIHPAQCLGISLRFTVVHDSLDVRGYQMYAVEKWIVERNRPVTVLIVYTGDLSHKISVTALRPSQDLSASDAQAEWDKALHHLRRDGARPKETPHGVLMATSLAHFRSDYTIVHIPDGNFLFVREQLYTNINLLRMGCSGRSALTLQEPSDATKDRFISTYHLPENIPPNNAHVTSTDFLPLQVSKTRSHSRSHSHSASVLNFSSPSTKHNTPEHTASPSGSISKAKAAIGIGLPSTFTFPQPESKVPSATSATITTKGRTTKDRLLFIATVLELVKLVQAGLALFGMYKYAPGSSTCPLLDGLLCDETVEGIRRWIIEVGEPCVGLEPMERIADPMFVAALLSLILAIRNKLAALGFSHFIPKDPFLQPHLFAAGLTVYLQSIHPSTTATTPAATHHDPFYIGTHGHSNTTSATTTPAPSHLGHGIGFGSPHFGGHIFPPYLHHTPPPTAPHLVPPQMTPSTSGSSSSNGPTAAPLPQAFLTRELVEAIGAAYDAKMRSAEGRGGGVRMRKALREKLRAGVDSEGDAGSGGFDRGHAERGTTSGGEGERGDRGGIGIVSGDREREREKETLGGVGTGVASSGGQILSGIGSFASGLGLGVGAGTTNVGAGGVLEATCDMAWFVRAVAGKDGKGKGRKATMGMGKGKERKGEAVDTLGVGYAYAYGGKEKEKDSGVAISARALWLGGISAVVRMREIEAEREKMDATTSVSVAGRKRDGVTDREKGKDRWALSDGDVDEPGATVKSETEEESDVAIAGGPGGFGGRMWGERVQKKLESWAGISKRRGHMSLDLSIPPSRTSTIGDPLGIGGNKFSSLNDPLSTARPAMHRAGTMPLSPTLPPMVFVGSADGDADDDDLLSSGQVSPIDDMRPSRFNFLHDGQSLESTSLTANTNIEYERKITEFNQKRPWGNRIHQSRVSSWADPVSAREIIDGDIDGEGPDMARNKRKRGDTVGSTLAGGSVLSEEPQEIGEETEKRDWSDNERIYDAPSRRVAMFGPRRRRSFHDLESLRGMGVLATERMRVDVELCGQLLIMTRREQHLQNVIACLHVLTGTLTNTNTLLREDYQSHLPFLSDLEARTQVISNIDAENAKADKTSQATHTLRYEAEQFSIPDLWHTATPSRQKVLAFREKVFGTGGRRLPQGVHGAHGRFNRLQWTLDERERLVDHLGRTESEAEEEESGVQFMGLQEEDEEDVVEHSGIKPMWLLRFFTSWGARWGAAAAQPEEDADKGSAEVKVKVESNGNGAAAKDVTTNTLLSPKVKSLHED